MIKYVSLQKRKGKNQMERNTNLILTGWGYAEYVAAAAVALKALDGEADVLGMSRRRLPEFLTSIAQERGEPRWKRLYLLGIALTGDPEALASALKTLRKRNVKVVWVSALPLPEDVAALLGGLLEVRQADASLLEVVGRTFHEDVEAFRPFLKASNRAPADVKAYFTLIEAAGHAYRNYQDEGLFATTVRYLARGVRPTAWEPVVKNAILHYERYGSRELIGKSAAMVALQDRISRVAAHEHARVLILGESGTGKETVALLIHTKSPRRDMPFVAFNCASVAKELLEDRFFGHERGAFTNAIERTDGLFRMADGGTLFLDEIGEMPVEVQALLLRVLEGGRFMRVGGHEELKCDVRLVTATNRDLPRLVREGKFRGDLYQRLNVVQLRTPSLREHMEDLPIIANAWWRKFHGNHVLDAAQLEALQDYDYPGNVRELINILDRATALEEEDFVSLMREHKEMNAALLGVRQEAPADFPDELEAAVRLHVRRVYDKCGQNLTRAVAALKVSRNTVRKYLSAP